MAHLFQHYKACNLKYKILQGVEQDEIQLIMLHTTVGKKHTAL